MGKKHSGTTRANISVPTDLKRRMAKVKEAVNWSSLACRAFEDKLGEIAAKREKKTMSDVIDRLRKSKRDSESGSYRQGFDVGTEWAEDSAKALELEALQRFYEVWRNEFHGDFDRYFSAERGISSAYSIAEQIYFALRPEDDQDRGAAEDFWITVLGDDNQIYEEPQFLRGFVEGTLDLWEQVKEKF